MRQRNPTVFLLEKNKDRAAAVLKLIGGPLVASATPSVIGVIEALARGEQVIAIVDAAGEQLPELAALARVPSLSSSIALIVAASHDSAEARRTSASHLHGDLVVLSESPDALSGAVDACERRLMQLAGMLQVGHTILHCRENRITTEQRDLRVQNATSSLLEALMRAYPRTVSHDELKTEVVRFAPDAHSGAVHTRIYQLRRALAEAEADVSIDFVEGQGYRLTVNSPGESKGE